MRWMVMVLIGASSYGMVAAPIKYAYEAGYRPGQMSGAQYLISLVFLWTLAAFSRGPKATWRDVLQLLAAGTTTGLTSLLYYNSLQHLDASIAIVMLFQFTWIGVLIEALINRKAPSAGKFGALLLLAVGTVLASGVLTTGISSLSPIGILYGLLSAVTYALFILFSGRVAPHLSSVHRSAMMLTGGCILILALYPPTFLFDGSLIGGLWRYASASALFSGIIPLLTFSAGIPHIGSGLGTILGAAELPAAVLMARLVLKDSVSGIQWVGVLIILVGIALPELLSRAKGGRQERPSDANDASIAALTSADELPRTGD